MMNCSEKISVIIPVYNTEKYLEASLRSVMNQTYTNLEIICVNDGSTDSSLSILERLAAEDSRIRIINQENAGQGAARNAGLEVATSEWITFPDSDDLLVPDAYETVAKAFGQNPDLVHFSIKVVYEDGTPTRKQDHNYYTVTRDGLCKLDSKTIITADGSVSNKFFRRDIIDKFGIRFEKRRYEDFQFSKEYLLVSDNIFCISRPLYIYLRREGSTMAQTFLRTPYSIDHLRAFQAVSDFMGKHCSDEIRSKVEPILFIQSYNFAICYADDETLPHVIQLAEDMYARNDVLKRNVNCKILHGTLIFYISNLTRYLKLAMEFLFAIKYESYDYKPFKIVRLFGFTLMRKPAAW